MLPEVNFDNFTFRCHYLGELLSPPKGKSNLEKFNDANTNYNKKFAAYTNADNKTTKSAVEDLRMMLKYEVEKNRLESIKNEPHLSVGCKSRLIQIYSEVTTGRIKDIKNKFLEKGLHVEEDAITDLTLYSQKYYTKNKERKDNKFINGCCDIVDDDDNLVIDTKSSWDIFTFDKVVLKPILSLYEWQGDGYMWLWNKKNFKLVYVLLNTPRHLIEKEKNKVFYEMFANRDDYNTSEPEIQDLYKEACAEIDRLSIYDDLKPERKIRIFDTKRNDDKIDQIKDCVVKCRQFLNNIGNLKCIEDVGQSDDDGSEI